METINVTNGPQGISRVILGCMRMPALSVQDAAAMIRAACASADVPGDTKSGHPHTS